MPVVFQTKSVKILWMCEICTFAHLQGLKNECDVPAVANESPCSLNSVRKADEQNFVLCTGTVAKKMSAICLWLRLKLYAHLKCSKCADVRNFPHLHICRLASVANECDVPAVASKSPYSLKV